MTKCLNTFVAHCSSVSPRPSESVSSQLDGSTSTHPNQTAAAAAAAAATQSNQCAQEQVKSNPGE